MLKLKENITGKIGREKEACRIGFGMPLLFK
jgi:hypothetical protein